MEPKPRENRDESATRADASAPKRDLGRQPPDPLWSPAAWWQVLKDAFGEWNADQAPMHGAALAFYSMLSLAPLILISIAVVGALFGEQAARGQVMQEVRSLVGEEGGRAIEAMLANARRPGAGLIATIIGVGTLLFGAAGVFGQLKVSLNSIWDATPRPNAGIWGFLRDQALNFAMILLIAALLVLSLVIGSVLSAVESFAPEGLGGLGPLAQIINLMVSFLLYVIMFAFIYRVLPDVTIAWKDVVVGSVITSALFLLGRSLIGLYLGKASLGSAYGAAGSLVVVLLWVYYSAQVLFFGAEVTQVYADRYGSRIVSSHARP